MARAEPLAESRASLYERDFYRWIEEQARLLREGELQHLDIVNLIEEIEDLGRNRKSAVKNNLVVVIKHLLKFQFQPRRRSRSWRGSIVEHRQRLRDDFEDSPSLHPYAAEVFARAYADARAQASAETGLPPETFPETSPWTLEQALDPEFLPE